jgi:hypothetical protein
MWQSVGVMTARELLEGALALPASERVKIAAELLASVAPGDVISAAEWEATWLSEVEHREALEPDETLGDEHELPNVRRRLLGLFP